MHGVKFLNNRKNSIQQELFNLCCSQNAYRRIPELYQFHIHAVDCPYIWAVSVNKQLHATVHTSVPVPNHNAIIFIS